MEGIVKVKLVMLSDGHLIEVPPSVMALSCETLNQELPVPVNVAAVCPEGALAMYTLMTPGWLIGMSEAKPIVEPLFAQAIPGAGVAPTLQVKSLEVTSVTGLFMLVYGLTYW